MPEPQVIKLVNATSLDAGLTSIANAIRTKGGTSADLAFPDGFVSAVEAIPTGGGSSVLTGTYTPTENTHTFSIDVGGPFTKFIIFEMSRVGDVASIRALRIAICHFDNNEIFMVSTNNTGSSVQMEQNYTSGGITKSNNTVTYNKSNVSAIATIQYKWFAW